ncbi:putative conjugal transfer protein TraB [Synergistales bacterium]|nr:putative conjugal transfer protein TraB [Synergistales bacterium]
MTSSILGKKNALIILLSALIGCVGLTTIPRAAVLILAVPALWTLADSRYAAFAVVLAYKLAASRGLLPGAAVFLSESHTFAQAAALYFIMPFGVSLPFLVFWSEKRKRKATCLVLAFITAYILPPLSLIGIINPLMASGTIFKGCGFAGILTLMTIYGLCVLHRKAACTFFCVIALFATLLNDSWYTPLSPEGFIAVNTSFGRLGSGSFNFERDYERAEMVFADLRNRTGVKKSISANVIVLPETIAGRLNNTGLELWKSEIQKLTVGKTDKTDRTAVLFGVELPTADGRKYDNALVMLHKNTLSLVPQRIPVPYSMYLGPFAKGGANLHLLGDGLLELPDGRTSAVIICYEAFLTWPYLVSMLHKPDMIISIANLWWCRETSLPVTHRTVISLWALTFGVPVVFALNI